LSFNSPKGIWKITEEGMNSYNQNKINGGLS